MFTERTSVGLDVHARSVAAAAFDGVTGELVQARLTGSATRVSSGAFHRRPWACDEPTIAVHLLLCGNR